MLPFRPYVPHRTSGVRPATFTSVLLYNQISDLGIASDLYRYRGAVPTLYLGIVVNDGLFVS